MQQKTIDLYLKLYDYPTFKTIAQDTGIQVTRIFRLVKGSEMKLSEYIVFQKLIKQKQRQHTMLIDFAQQCLDKLSKPAVKQLEDYIQRRLDLWELSKQPQDPKDPKEGQLLVPSLS
ncbi:MAG: hypothetical protein ISR65_10985 [Bacteriovoracaceae bacterium]|nr:hypothetical protein [Bacteriovoracaceae bacterium]